MPDDRFIHPRLRMSQKVSALSDFEYRIWTDYILAADNFGVMPDLPALHRANLAIAARPEHEIRAAMDNIIKSGLVLTFEHQGQRFICDPMWQNFQHVRYPKSTFYPVPVPEIFREFSAETQTLFKTHHPALRKKSSAVSRANHRLKAKANGNGLGQEAEAEPTFEGFYALYPKKADPHRAEKAWNSAVKIASAAEIMAGLRAQLPELKSREKRFIPYPATWLNGGGWKNEPEGRSGRANLSGGFNDTPPGPVKI